MRGHTIEIKLKKFTSNSERHSDVGLSAILFTGSRVPWLRIRQSIVLNASSAEEIAFFPTYIRMLVIELRSVRIIGLGVRHNCLLDLGKATDFRSS